MMARQFISLISLFLVILTAQAEAHTCADELNFLTERVSIPLQAALAESPPADTLQVRLKYGHRRDQAERDAQLILNDLVFRLRQRGRVEQAALGEINELAVFPEIEFQGTPDQIGALIKDNPELLRAELVTETGWEPENYYETDGTLQLNLTLLDQPAKWKTRHDLGTGSHEVRLSHELQRTLVDDEAPKTISLTIAGQAPVASERRQDFVLQLASEMKTRGFIIKAIFLSAKAWYRIDVAAETPDIVNLMGTAPTEFIMFTTDQFDKAIPFSFNTAAKQ